MSTLRERLDNCSTGEQRTALLWLLGYTPGAMDLALSFVEADRKPPRIPEPGLWGVVEAKPGTNPDAEREEFVRFPDDNPDGHWESKWYGGMAWDELVDPVLIREGLS